MGDTGVRKLSGMLVYWVLQKGSEEICLDPGSCPQAPHTCAHTCVHTSAYTHRPLAAKQIQTGNRWYNNHSPSMYIALCILSLFRIIGTDWWFVSKRHSISHEGLVRL